MPSGGMEPLGTCRSPGYLCSGNCIFIRGRVAAGRRYCTEHTHASRRAEIRAALVGAIPLWAIAARTPFKTQHRTRCPYLV